MADPSDVEARLAALEARVEEVAADTAAARHLAAAGDRDLADLGVKVDANRRAINAFGVQTAARFDRVDQRFDGVDQRLDGVDQRFAGVYQRFDLLEHEMRTGFAEMRGKFDQAAAGQQQIVDLLSPIRRSQVRGAASDVVEPHSLTLDQDDTAPPGGERRAGREEKRSAYS